MPPPLPNCQASESDYEQLHALFLSSGFHIDAILGRLKIGKLSDVDPLRHRLKDFGPVESAGDALVHVFVEGKPIAAMALDALIGVQPVALLKRLNLIYPLDEHSLAASVSLYPIEHIYIASDRYNSADASQFEGFDDMVYPCLFITGERFRRMISRTPCGTVLDLCSGTAFAALLLAKSSEHVYAADITERCRQFAVFNARMNGIRNFTAVTGDLYEPLKDLKFDRIVVHPPYQPVFRHQQIFNSGGVDGEQVTRKVVEQAPAHLNPGGRMYCVAQITARHVPVEQRVREWIAGADCDVAFFVTKRHEIELFAAKATLGAKGTELDFRAWLREFSRLGVRSLDYGLLILERHGAAAREAFTVGHRTPEEWDAADFEAIFAWELERRAEGFESRVWAYRFRAAKSAKLEVDHVLGEDGTGWELLHYRITQSGPFDVKIQASQGLAHLLALMDGRRTVAECYAEIEQTGAGVDRRSFLDTTLAMVSEGFLLRVL